MNAIENVSRPADRGLAGTSKDGGRPDSQHAQQLVRSTVLAALGQSAGAHGLRGVVDAIRSALSSPDSSSADPAADVLKKINDALQHAGKQLADEGLDPASVAATLAHFRSNLARALDKSAGSDAIPASAPVQPSGSVDRFAARAVRTETSALDVVTTEGDRVSIRFLTQDVLTTSASQSTSADGTTTTTAAASSISRGGLQVQVTGNLNDKERTAIDGLLTQVDALATKFFSGDVQAAFTAALHINASSDQIAGFKLDLTYSQKVSAAASFASAPGATAITPSQHTTLPSATPADENAPTTTTNQATSTPALENASAPDSSSASAPATINAPPASANQTIGNFIQDVFSKLGSANGADRLNFSLSWKVSLLLTALSSNSPPVGAAADTTRSSTTKLLGDMLHKAMA